MINECHDDLVIEHSGGPIINQSSPTTNKYVFTAVNAGLRQLVRFKAACPDLSANVVKEVFPRDGVNLNLLESMPCFSLSTTMKL